MARQNAAARQKKKTIRQPHKPRVDKKSVGGKDHYPDDNPKTVLGLKKVSLTKVPAAAVLYAALAMQDGANKYGPYNWRSKRVTASIYIDACLRHLAAWFDGEELAEDSKVPHLGHALACLSILIDAKETGNLNDDRPLPGPAAKLFARYTKKV